MKIRPVRTELFDAEGRADGQREKYDEANSRFSENCKSDYKLHEVIS